MTEKDYLGTKFLNKVKELAQSQKFEPVPADQKELWVTRMWTSAVIMGIIAAGYEIKKKEEHN